MIWHFLEVWLFVVASFAVGCAIGALVYDILARTSLATAQRAIADSIGDVVDRMKDRLGVGPVWSHRRVAASAGMDSGHGSDNEYASPVAEHTGTTGRADARAEHPAMADRTPSAGPVERWQPAEDRSAPTPVRPPAETAPSATVRWALPAPSIAPAGAARGAGAAAGSARASREIVPKRPATLREPRNGVPDNLQRIRGIGERNEKRLNALGIFHFGQIAAWTPAEMRWVAQRLAFPERMERDDWIGQAMVLASGSDTGLTKSWERRRMRRLQQRMLMGQDELYDDDDDEEDDET